MARASAVWVVLDGGRGAPVAGFTVKHELVLWLSRRASLEDLEVWRCDDGPWQGEPVRVDPGDLRSRVTRVVEP